MEKIFIKFRLLKYTIISFMDFKTLVLWHPESPGMKVTVVRSKIARFFNPYEFATLSESIKSKR